MIAGGARVAAKAGTAAARKAHNAVARKALNAIARYNAKVKHNLELAEQIQRNYQQVHVSRNKINRMSKEARLEKLSKFWKEQFDAAMFPRR